MSKNGTKVWRRQRLILFLKEALDFFDERIRVWIGILVVFLLMLAYCVYLSKFLPERLRFHYTAHFINLIAFFLSAGHSLILLCLLKTFKEEHAKVIQKAKYGFKVLNITGIVALICCIIYLGVLLFSIGKSPEFIAKWSPKVIIVLSVVLILLGIFFAIGDHLLLHRDLVHKVDFPFIVAMTILFVFSIYFSGNHSDAFNIGVASGAISMQLIVTVLVVPKNSYTLEIISKNFNNEKQR